VATDRTGTGPRNRLLSGHLVTGSQLAEPQSRRWTDRIEGTAASFTLGHTDSLEAHRHHPCFMWWRWGPGWWTGPADASSRKPSGIGDANTTLYRSRKLLTVAEERLDDTGRAKLTGLLAAGDPNGEVHQAWAAKEAVRDLYTMWDQEPAARDWLNGLIEDCREGKSPEVRGMAHTLSQWREAILAWHTTGASNGPVEGLNSMIKKVKRVAAGFRNLANYRTRILLAVGGCNWSLLGTQPR